MIMKKLFFVIVALAGLSVWSCSVEDDLNYPFINNEGHSDCRMSTDAEYLATKEIATDSVVVEYNGYTLHVEHRNMVLDCNNNPTFQNYVGYEGDTLVLREYVGEQGRTDCFCLYDNWFDVDDVLPQQYHWLKVVVEYDLLGERKSYTVYLNSLSKERH